MAQSVVRQNYHESCEMAVNKQINMELLASYTYMSMACYFDRDDVAFPGFHAYFKKQSDEEREHASKLMKFQNDRGGRVMLQPVAKPAKDEWGTPLQAVKVALDLEKAVNASLLELHKLAGEMTDPHMCDFIETHFLNEQVESIRELAGMATQLERCGSNLGEFLFDKHLQS